MGGGRVIVGKLLRQLITTLIDPGIIGGVGTDRGFGSYLEKATRLSHKIKEVINLRASLRDMHKNHRIDAGPLSSFCSSLYSFFLPPVEESLAGEDGELFSWHEHLSTQEYPYNPYKVMEKWKASLLEIEKRSQMKKKGKKVLDVDMKKLVEEHKATVNQIAEEHEATMARSEQKQTVQKFKRKTLENLSNLVQELKSNILLYAQVVGGPFNARGVDLDALSDVDMNQLGLDRNSKYFYLDEDLTETNTTPANNNEADEDPTEVNVALADSNDNNKVAGREGEDEIPSEHEGANYMF
ncbi:hypothetical protein GOBAR_AA01150 [Gossypium barbadense]|uniref:Uncharacterized protein n=1 Tax=Gossypium barbadense TaxID=3634 RepID=A0A2P5YUZ3_GOSBA|nr:hypothetical protein GOBAR_AA01150 [Gossypium barbadense]